LDDLSEPKLVAEKEFRWVVRKVVWWEWTTVERRELSKGLRKVGSMEVRMVAWKELKSVNHLVDMSEPSLVDYLVLKTVATKESSTVDSTERKTVEY
jgi:carbamoylphosphate synthase small subunit